jgi:hypothetical protein
MFPHCGALLVFIWFVFSDFYFGYFGGEVLVDRRRELYLREGRGTFFIHLAIHGERGAS